MLYGQAAEVVQQPTSITETGVATNRCQDMTLL